MQKFYFLVGTLVFLFAGAAAVNRMYPPTPDTAALDMMPSIESGSSVMCTMDGKTWPARAMPNGIVECNIADAPK